MVPIEYREIRAVAGVEVVVVGVFPFCVKLRVGSGVGQWISKVDGGF